MKQSKQTGDILYNCAESYKRLMGQSFTFEFGNLYDKKTIALDESQFLHLSSIEKLNDLPELEGASSLNIFNLILNKDLTYDQLTTSTHFSEQSYLARSKDGILNGVTYTLKDRLIALTHLFDLLNNINNQKGEPNIEVYKWEAGNNIENKRPFHSKISADKLIEFVDIPPALKKTPDDRICFFISPADKDGKSFGVSIFPSDVSFSDDGKIHQERCTVLSAIRTYKKHNVDLIKADPVQLQQAMENSTKLKQKRELKDIMADFKTSRKDFLKRFPDGVNNSSGRKTKYENMIIAFKNEAIYSTSLLAEIKDRLKDALKDVTDKKTIECIQKEIKDFEEVLESRKPQIAAENDKKEKSLVTALTAGATSALASDSANSSNNTQQFSLKSSRKQQLFDISRPVYAGQAAEAIAPSPLFDISKIIIALQALNEKITNAIHTFTDSFSLSHAPKQSTQEQPPQARTAHERKVNSELPFPKQKHADERTEPVKAKPEKYDVKPAEKQSSWIGSLLNSAKSEADEHNKNHEPKAHDKDKSL